jgi:hypothetical protein
LLRAPIDNSTSKPDDIAMLHDVRVSALIVAVVLSFGLVGSTRAQGICEFQESAALAASDAGVGDHFEEAVAIDGEWFIVGAPFQDGAGSNSGAAYLYRYDPTGPSWVEHTRLLAPDPGGYACFGSAVAIEGDRCAVGAKWDSESAPGAGAVYVFRRMEDAWSFDAKLLASDGAVGVTDLPIVLANWT